jgi:hypothetical protein
MTTRTYYLPKNRISLYIINHIVSKVGCSIGELKINRQLDIICVPITCNDVDITKIERILRTYDMIGD